MLRKLIIFGICAGSSASIPILYQSNPDAVMSFLSGRFSDASPRHAAATEPEDGAEPATLTLRPASGKSVSIARDARGHFVGDFKFNGRKVEALVDTGATAVAINLSTARRIGVPVTLADLTGTVSTANGDTRAAAVTIDRLDIGRISVDNVQAIVLEDRALSGTLIGMTFLNRLKTFKVDGGAMTLAQ